MNDVNPYEAPLQECGGCPDAVSQDRGTVEPIRAISTKNTVMPRYVAALLDNFLALVLAVIAAKSVSNDFPFVQLFALVIVYLAYYLLSEGLMSRTPGKLLTGLVVVRVDGQRCSWRQIVIRTEFRVLEVNPALLGAIPAAVCILFSKRHQRLGDMVAGTIVVPKERVQGSR